MSDDVIELHGLTKSFRRKTIVDHLSLAVPRGAIFGLLGANGVGKTTTIRMLVGLLPPDAGRAVVLGQDCWRDAATLRPRIGYVPERPRFYDWMTVGELGWFTAGFHADGFLPRFQALTERFQLDPSVKLARLSKGQYAEVALAVALASEPEVLILDEPTAGLDPIVHREFLASMVAFAAEGRTVFISSHALPELERVASHVAFVSEGKLLLAGTVDELRQRIVRLRMRCEAPPPDPNRLGTVLQRNGTGKQVQVVLQDPNRQALVALQDVDGIFDVEERPLTLEELYIALLGRKEGQL